MKEARQVQRGSDIISGEEKCDRGNGNIGEGVKCRYFLSCRGSLGEIERGVRTHTSYASDYLGHKQTSQEALKGDGSERPHLFKCLKRSSQRRMG